MRAVIGVIVARMMPRKMSYRCGKDSDCCPCIATGTKRRFGLSRKPTGARRQFYYQMTIKEWEGRKMSAFIVDPECINSIVTYIYRNREHFGWLHREHGYDPSK